ncbi:MAG: hypothetical protein HY432_00060 [Candidatus Liptonbacteria bacterium]|nr:hypothetical protein [Candidatus Liptonbacteria bacterium]
MGTICDSVINAIKSINDDVNKAAMIYGLTSDEKLFITIQVGQVIGDLLHTEKKQRVEMASYLVKLEPQGFVELIEQTGEQIFEQFKQSTERLLTISAPNFRKGLVVRVMRQIKFTDFMIAFVTQTATENKMMNVLH